MNSGLKRGNETWKLLDWAASMVIAGDTGVGAEDVVAFPEVAEVAAEAIAVTGHVEVTELHEEAPLRLHRPLLLEWRLEQPCGLGC